MQITITIADKTIKNAIDNALDNNLYEYFDSATIKAANLPKRATVIKDIMADAKFQKAFAKRMVEAAESACEDSIWDDISYEVELPFLNDLIDKCESVTLEVEEAAQAEREAEEVKRMVKTLEKAGFKIVKA
jgi:hypothetical protein